MRPQQTTGGLSIGQLATLTSVSAKAIRYYEDIGLLPKPPRGANSYRRYGQPDVSRLHLLRRIRLLGVPLAVAKPLLLGATDAQCAEVREDLLALVEKRLHVIDQEMAELRQLRADVVSYQRALMDCHITTSEPFSDCEDLSCIVAHGDAEGGISNACARS